MWELACLRWHHLGIADSPRRLHRRQASSHTNQLLHWPAPTLECRYLGILRKPTARRFQLLMVAMATLKSTCSAALNSALSNA